MSADHVMRLAQERVRAGASLDDLRPALDAFMAELRAKLLRIVCARGVEGERAEDIVNEALLIGWRRLHEFDFASTFDAWAWGICRMLMYSRQRQGSAVLLVEDGVVEGTSEATALSMLRAQEQSEVLQAAIAALPSDEQAVLHLRYVDGLPVREIDQRLRLKGRSGARGVLVRMRRRLEKQLRAALAQRNHRSTFFLTTHSL